MRAALWPDADPDELAQEVSQFLATPDPAPLPTLQAAFVCVREAGGLCGFVEVSIRPYAEGCETNRVGYVEGWYVDPDQRQLGIGRQLIAAAEQWARSMHSAARGIRQGAGMNILVILGHPEPGSFNHAIADAVGEALERNGHQVVLHDLYAERFDPLLPAAEIPRAAPLPAQIQQHCDDLKAAQGIVIIHPNWWGQPPAILKGWIDRVIRPEVAYRFREGDAGDGVPEGLLQARTAIIFNTSNTPRERELRAFGDPLELLWRNCIFDLCGVQQVYRRMFEVVITSTPAQRAQWLAEVRDTVERYCISGIVS